MASGTPFLGLFSYADSNDLMFTSSWRSYPITIIIAVVASLALAVPGLSNWLQLDFSAVADGQWWRVWTGHLTHYDGQHLFWDLLMFVVLGAACEKENPRQFAAAIALMAAGITVAIGLFCHDITVYRGLSGVDTGLFVWFVGDQCRRSWIAKERVAATIWIVSCLALIGKLIFEAMTGKTLFVEASTFTPLVESHLAGAVIGLMFVTLRCHPIRNPLSSCEACCD